MPHRKLCSGGKCVDKKSSCPSRSERKWLNEKLLSLLLLLFFSSWTFYFDKYCDFLTLKELNWLRVIFTSRKRFLQSDPPINFNVDQYSIANYAKFAAVVFMHKFSAQCGGKSKKEKFLRSWGVVWSEKSLRKLFIHELDGFCVCGNESILIWNRFSG